MIRSISQCKDVVQACTFNPYTPNVSVFSALTDPLIAGIARGSKAYKLIGTYVTTPLNW